MQGLKMLPMYIGQFMPVLISTAALALSFTAFLRTRRSDRINQTYDLINEWRSPGLHDDVQFILEKFREIARSCVTEKGVAGLPKDVIPKFLRVSFFMDYVGIALLSETLDEKVMFNAIGQPAVRLWRVMSPIIKAERILMQQDPSLEPIPKGKIRETWQGAFEHFAATAQRFSPDQQFKLLTFRD